MTDTLYRAMSIGDTTGRTLSGLAMPFDRPTYVRDSVGGPFPGRSYREAFAPTSTDVTLRHHSSFPVMRAHNYLEPPVGVVTFQRSSEGLIFEAPLLPTDDGDDTLQRVKSGEWSSVSVGFQPLREALRTDSDGQLVYRTEVRLVELSLAPTGRGQYEDARVIAVRTEPASTPKLDAMKRIAARLPRTL